MASIAFVVSEIIPSTETNALRFYIFLGIYSKS